MAIHLKMYDSATLAGESGGALGLRRWRHGTLVSPRFLAYEAPNRALFLPTAPHWQEQLGSQTFRRQRSTETSGGVGFFVMTLAGVEELLRSTSGFKNRTRSFLASTCRSYADSMAPIMTNSLNLVAARVWRVLSFADKNLHLGVRYL
jgi:hypothetical protein